MVMDYRSEIDTVSKNIRNNEGSIEQQYNDLQNFHKTEDMSQERKYNEEKAAQERIPGADTPDELLKKAKEYQDRNS